MPVFFSFSFYLYYSFCSSACGGLGIIPPPPPGNTAYILYQVSLVHKKKKQFLVILDTIRCKTFIKNISPSTQHPLLRVNQGAGHPLSPFPASGAAARFSWLIRRTLHYGSAAARHKAGCRKRYAARKPQQPRTPRFSAQAPDRHYRKRVSCFISPLKSYFSAFHRNMRRYRWYSVTQRTGMPMMPMNGSRRYK